MELPESKWIGSYVQNMMLGMRNRRKRTQDMYTRWRLSSFFSFSVDRQSVARSEARTELSTTALLAFCYSGEAIL